MAPNKPLRLGTRGSTLALAQANQVSKLLSPLFGQVEIVTIRTSGDKGERDRLGAFVREIQEALLDNKIDLGLHCLKDLPTTPVEGLTFAAHLPREDVRDAVLTRGERWTDLLSNSVVGTGSVRRTLQLASVRPDFQFRRLVGNVDTRLRKLMDGEYDAIVLALAGLKRLGVFDSWSESPYSSLLVEALDVSAMVPAPGQAVLVLEARSDDVRVLELAGGLNHQATEACSKAERAFLHRFGGGCSVPVGAHATIRNLSLELVGLVASPDGTKVLKGTASGPEEHASAIGVTLADELGSQGAFKIVDAAVGARVI